MDRKKLDILVRTLSKTKTTLSELLKLDKDHKGIIIVYWTTYWRNAYPKFIGTGGWWEMMEDKEPDDSDYWEDDESSTEIESEAVSELEIADRIIPVPTIDVDAAIAKIIEENP